MPTSRPRDLQFWGIVTTGLGVAVVAMVALHPENLRAPAWVVYAAASTFVFAGITMIADARGAGRWQRWLAIPILLALAVPAAWVAFGPGDRECTLSLPFVSTTAGEALCRGAFGLGFLLAVAIAVPFARRAWRRDVEP
jgi:hypothetical protein